MDTLFNNNIEFFLILFFPAQRIPLVPRRPKSGDIAFNKDKKEKRLSQKRDKGDNQSETPVLPTDPDERVRIEISILFIKSLPMFELVSAVN